MALKHHRKLLIRTAPSAVEKRLFRCANKLLLSGAVILSLEKLLGTKQTRKVAQLIIFSSLLMEILSVRMYLSAECLSSIFDTFIILLYRLYALLFITYFVGIWRFFYLLLF